MEYNKVLFKVDAGYDVGLGHLSRSFALAQKLIKKNIYTKIFIEGNISLTLAKHFTNNLIDIEILNSSNIWQEFYDLIQPNDTIIIDSYNLPLQYQQQIKKKCKKLILIDDHTNKKYEAHAVINTSTNEKPLPNASYKQFYGIEYALLRDEFLKTPTSVHRNGILVSMGGSDPKNITTKLIYLLLELNIKQPIHIMYTSSYSNEQQTEILELKKQRAIHTHLNLKPQEIVSLMDTCKYGIFPASNSLLEALKRNLICAYGYFTDNQKKNYELFKMLNAGVDLKNFSNIETEQINNLLETKFANVLLSKTISSKLNELIQYISNEN